MRGLTLTVSQLNEYVRRSLASDPMLHGLCLTGELSNFKRHTSGHWYFTLKDEEAAINCAMFRQAAMGVRFRPENGQRVRLFGSVGLYARTGAYQFYADAMEPGGLGELYLRFEALKQKLAAEGLFDPSLKKPLPLLPRGVGIVTSRTGAVVHDIARVSWLRYPGMPLYLCPVKVQGEGAAAEIAAAIRLLDAFADVDVMIVGRGGGSMEDLWAFNDERVARAIADSHIPVISAVGHEPDVTISDFVADLRAATPSNAAELAVPDQTELRQHLAAQRAMLLTLMTRRLKQERQRVAQLVGARALRDPKNYIDDRRMQLDYTQRRLIAALQRLVAQQRERFVRLTSKLDAMSPLKVLSRGYSMTFDAQGHVVRSVRTLSCGDRITVRLADGRASAEVREIQEDAT